MRDPIALEESSLPERFGPFVLLRPLGVGGMGVAHLAVESRGDELFVVKRLRPDLGGDPVVARRFAHEAQVAEHVRHPNVTAPLAMGSVQGEPFLVTEYVFGVAASELVELVQAGDVEEIPLGVALSIAVGVASGLEAIHEARHRETGATLGLVHRDLGARNVLIGFDGSPRIIDLGLGKSSLAGWQTATHALAGSPDYMAPEQASGGTADARSDVYSAAVLIWELFAGRKWIREATVGARLARALDQKAEPLRRYRPDAPEALERALLDAMAAEPDHRTQSAAELKAALMRVWSSTGIDASPMDVVSWMDTCLPWLRRREELALQTARANAHVELARGGGPLEAFTAVRSGFDFRSPYDFYGVVDEDSEPHPALERCPPDFVERITTEVRARFGKASLPAVAGEVEAEGRAWPSFLRRLTARVRTAFGLLALSSIAGMGTAGALSFRPDSIPIPVVAPSRVPQPRGALPTADSDPEREGGDEPRLMRRRESLVVRIRRARQLRPDVLFQRKVTELSNALSRARSLAALEAIELDLKVLESES